MENTTRQINQGVRLCTHSQCQLHYASTSCRHTIIVNSRIFEIISWIHLPPLPVSVPPTLPTFLLPFSLPPSLPPSLLYTLPPSLSPFPPSSLPSSLPPSSTPKGAACSGDNDILLGHPDFSSESTTKPHHIRTIVEKLETEGFVTESLSIGESKFMVTISISV